ncbi:MAG: hypothetical protein KGP35_07690 [Bacteroidetes bacterium]|nr:hypothetical protein [Bacteroidota bacterium]
MYKIIVSTSRAFTNGEVFAQTLDSVISEVAEEVTLLIPENCVKTRQMALRYAIDKQVAVKIIGAHSSFGQFAAAIQSDALAREGHYCLLFQTGIKTNIKLLEEACEKYQKPIRYVRA